MPADQRPGLEPNERCPDDHDLAVWYTPSAVRLHLEEHEEAEPRLAEVTDQDLAAAALEVLTNNDSLWEQFDSDCHLILDRAHEAAKKRAGGPPPCPECGEDHGPLRRPGEAGLPDYGGA